MEKNTKLDLTEDAKEALELISYIREKGGVEEYSKYKQVEAFIKEQGTVSPVFLENLKDKRDKLR